MKKFTIRAGLILLCFLLLCHSVSAASTLIPVGQVIGLELPDDSVRVAGFDQALGSGAKAAGLQVGDRITQVDGIRITCVQDVRDALDRADTQVKLQVQRGNRDISLLLEPGITADGPRLGVYLKQGVTGIGTVTWYDPHSGRFGALGHGVNDPDGKLLQTENGSVYAARVQSVKPGKVGAPGQLVGALEAPEPIGTVEKNTAQGVFGTLQQNLSGEPLPIGSREQISAGSAHILSTVNGKQPREYSVEILKVYPHSRSGGRNLLLKVTDPALLDTTGGIVQGMSGSPIIQDGKLIGAVTHVLVNDPTTGYGIFIENMLDAAA